MKKYIFFILAVALYAGTPCLPRAALASFEPEDEATTYQNTTGITGDSFFMISGFKALDVSAGFWVDSRLYFFGRLGIWPLGRPSLQQETNVKNNFLLFLGAGQLDVSPDEGFLLSSGAYRPGFYALPWKRPLGVSFAVQKNGLLYRFDHYLAASESSSDVEPRLYGGSALSLHSVNFFLTWPFEMTPGIRYMSLKRPGFSEKEFWLLRLATTYENFSLSLQGGLDYGLYIAWTLKERSKQGSLFLGGGYHSGLVQNPFAASYFEKPETLFLKLSMRPAGNSFKRLSFAFDLKDLYNQGGFDFWRHDPDWSFRFKALFREEVGLYGYFRHGKVEEQIAYWARYAPSADVRMLSVFGSFGKVFRRGPDLNFAFYLAPIEEASVENKNRADWLDWILRIGLGNREFGIAFLYISNLSASLYPVDPLYFPFTLTQGSLGADLFLYSDRGGPGLEGFFMAGGFRLAARLFHDPALGMHQQFDVFLRISYESRF